MARGTKKFEKVLGIPTSKAIRLARLSDRQGLGSIVFQRALPSEGQLVAASAVNVLLSTVTKDGEVVNGFTTAAEKPATGGVIVTVPAGGWEGNVGDDLLAVLSTTALVAVDATPTTGVVPGSVRINTTLVVGATDYAVTITDLPQVPVTGESGRSSVTSGPGMDGLLYLTIEDEGIRNLVVGTINYFTSAVAISLPSGVIGVKQATDVLVDYNTAAKIPILGNIRVDAKNQGAAAANAVALEVAPVDAELGIFAIAQQEILTVRAEILAHSDGVQIATI